MDESERSTHRKLAVTLFNRVWELLDLKERSAEQDLEMIHAAHASRLHWTHAGTARNWNIGEWQISRVYAVLGRAEPTLYHARQALKLCEAHALDAFVTAFSHEALARACAIDGNIEAAREHIEAATRCAGGIAEAGEKKSVLDDLATVPLQ